MTQPPKNGRLSKVEARPVLESLREPDYPTSTEVSSSKNHWGKAAAGAATFFLAINIGGVAESIPPLKPADRPAVAQQARETLTTNTRQNQNTTIVAPLFNHGEGRGSMGCIVVSPPVFLSEEEAMQVIKDELGKYGVKLGPGGELKDLVVQMPITGMHFYRKPDPSKVKHSPVPLDIDAMDREKKVIVEFVSLEDFNKTRAKSGMMSSVRSYDLKQVARHLVKEAAGKGKQTRYLGVFYDPMNWSRAELKKKEKEEKKANRGWITKDESKKLLRQQASDFAKWLDKQGVKLTKQETEEEKE